MKVVHYLKLTFAIAALVAVAPAIGYAAKPATVKTPLESVEMFAAMKAGDIEVKLIPKDSTTGTVLIKNKTKKPLSIQLPEAFAGVPVLAQGGFGAGLGADDGGSSSNNQNQSMGGGMMGGMGGMMGGMGGGMGGMGGGGFFNVAPEKVAKMPIVAVCLEHGKKDPNPRVAYELRPIESATQKAEVIELVKMLNRGEVDQRTAQAAAWHLANGLSWQELANKIGAKHLNGTVEPYFTQRQLNFAMHVTREATRRAERLPENSPSVESPGESLQQQ